MSSGLCFPMERTNVHIISAGCITRVMHTGEWTVLRLFREAEKQRCTEGFKFIIKLNNDLRHVYATCFKHVACHFYQFT